MTILFTNPTVFFAWTILSGIVFVVVFLWSIAKWWQSEKETERIMEYEKVALRDLAGSPER